MTWSYVGLVIMPTLNIQVTEDLQYKLSLAALRAKMLKRDYVAKLLNEAMEQKEVKPNEEKRPSTTSVETGAAHPVNNAGGRRGNNERDSSANRGRAKKAVRLPVEQDGEKGPGVQGAGVGEKEQLSGGVHGQVSGGNVTQRAREVDPVDEEDPWADDPPDTAAAEKAYAEIQAIKPPKCRTCGSETSDFGAKWVCKNGHVVMK